MFGWEFPPQITGGLGTACYGITKSLAKQNVDVLFVFPKAYGNEDDRYVTLQDAGKIPSRYLGSDDRAFWEKVLFREIYSSLAPFITHIHATEFDRSGWNINSDIYNIEKKGMELSDKVISVSNYTRNIIIKNYGITPEKIVTVYNAVEKSATLPLQKIKSLCAERIVTFLGRLTFQKGPERFIEAASKVLRKNRNVRFILAGSGDMKDKLVWQAENLGISSRVSFPGFLKSEERKNLFSITDVFVMPSVSEPFGISPLEALRSGVPVIISKQSGVSEVIKHAIKVDHWDTDTLSEAINGILHYKALSKLLSVKGNREADRLDWGRAGSQILNVYKSLLK